MEPTDLLVDVAKLGVAVRVLRAFPGLAVACRLQPAAANNSATSCRLTTWPIACSAAVRLSHGLRRPAQRRRGATRRGGFHQALFSDKA